MCYLLTAFRCITEIDSIVWHARASLLDGANKRQNGQIDTIMADCSIYNFTTDAVGLYTRAVWAKFALLAL